MKLSVIIPTRNRAALLEKALESLLVQTLSQDDFEVIVVDNGSTDNTFEVVNAYKARLKNIRYFLEHQPGLHVGRNKGCLEAESDILVYADDDIEAFSTWLQAIGNSFEDENVVMVGGKCLPDFESEPPMWLNDMWLSNTADERILGYLSLIDLGDKAKLVTPYHVFGCNFAIRRSLLLEAGGFHPDAMPQELILFRGDGESHVSEYVQTKGCKALYNPLASIYHWVPANRMTPDYFYRRSYNQGISDSYTAIRLANRIDTAPVKTSGVPDFYRRLRCASLPWIYRTALRICRGLVLHVKGEGSLAREEAALRRNLVIAYKQGYSCHQAQVMASPELLAWVLRPDYWDFRLPYLAAREDI